MQKEKRNFYNEVDFGKKGKFLETNFRCKYSKIGGRLHVWTFLQVIENMISDNRDREWGRAIT